jgi:uncharacterized membrane protein (DUF485 family)
MSTLQSAAKVRPAEGNTRTFVRRLYFYGMALISFIAIMIAIDNLVTVLDTIWLGGGTEGVLYAIDSYTRDAIAGNGGVLLVATPIFLVHWGAIQRRRDAEELHGGMRKFFLYAATVVAIIYTTFNAYDLLQGIAQTALGVPLEQSLIWPIGWLHDLLMFVIGFAVTTYWLRRAAQDGDLGQEIGVAGTWRRLFLTAAGFFGLWLVIMGSWGLLETLLRLVVGAAGLDLAIAWWRPQLGDHIAQLLLGSLLLRINWVRWQTLAVAHPQEAQSALRRFYLYVAVVAGAVTLLLPLSQLLRALLLVLFGELALDDLMLIDVLTTTLAAAPVGLLVWRWHWRFLQQEAAAYGESNEGAVIRRLYYYAVAATGLVMLWFGIVDVVQVGMDWVTGRVAVAGERIWVYPLATGLSLLTIAAPIWAFHWQVVQRVARQDSAAGLAERASGPRKVYLYGAALASGLIILYYLAQVVYRLLLLLLGDTSAGFVGTEAAGDLARSAIAAIIWIVHFMAIRGDSAMGTEMVEADEVSIPVALDEQRSILEARINLLEMQLHEARTELAALPPGESGQVS